MRRAVVMNTNEETGPPEGGPFLFRGFAGGFPAGVEIAGRLPAGMGPVSAEPGLWFCERLGAAASKRRR